MFISFLHNFLLLVSICFPLGTMGSVKEDSPTTFLPEVGSFFSFSNDWKPTKHASKITVSNGLAWSEDLKSMYYIDSPTRKVVAFDLDAKNVKICKYSCSNTQYNSI